MKLNKVTHVPAFGTAIKDVFLVKITADFTFLEIALSAASNCESFGVPRMTWVERKKQVNHSCINDLNGSRLSQKKITNHTLFSFFLVSQLDWKAISRLLWFRVTLLHVWSILAPLSKPTRGRDLLLLVYPRLKPAYMNLKFCVFWLAKLLRYRLWFLGLHCQQFYYKNPPEFGSLPIKLPGVWCGKYSYKSSPSKVFLPSLT